MGIVLAGTHLSLNHAVAIKVLHAELRDPSFERRFLREARITAQLRSEHVVRVIDLGTTDGGIPYLVMERLHGSDLAAVLETRGPLPVSEAVSFVLQACEALAEAHAHGLVHRDLKPHNLFLVRATDGSPHVKVLDFGIARRTDRVSDVTATGGARPLGTPRYMSPEQIRGAADLDQRADIWSVGVILYRLTTACYPFDGDDVAMLTARILTDPHAPWRSPSTSGCDRLARVIDRCLEKDRERRYPDVAALAHDLASLAPDDGAAWVARIERILEASASDLTETTGKGDPSEPGETMSMPAPDPTARSWATANPRVTAIEPARAAPPFARRYWVALLPITAVALGLTWWGARSPKAMPPAPTRTADSSAHPPTSGVATVAVVKDAGFESSPLPIASTRPMPRRAPRLASPSASATPNASPPPAPDPYQDRR